MVSLFSPGETYHSRNSVTKDEDWRRINALPWRDPVLPDKAFCEDLSSFLQRPGGIYTLFPIQAQALEEAYEYRRLFGAIPVGYGKTFISLLIPVITEAKRPVLFVPAALREQTEAFVLPDMRRNWKTHSLLTILSYEQLSSVNFAHILDQIQPDQLIFDEVHKIKDHKAGRTKRILRYFEKHPETECYAMSGSVLNRSLHDYSHILMMTHKEDAPLPLAYHSLNDWCDALDARVKSRRKPGPILQWYEGEPISDTTMKARKAYHRRLVHTPGVVAGSVNLVGNGLEMFEREVEVPEKIQDALVKLREEWCTPGGEEFSDRLELWRHAAELACGFYYRWEPPPPKEWAHARSDYHRMIRALVAHNRRDLDTPLQVVQAIDNGYYPDAKEILDEWRDIQDIYDPEAHREAVWLDDFLVRDAEAWARKYKGIVWVTHRAVGERFESIPYFGGGDERILTHTGPCAASIWSHGTGKNLQHHHNSLVLSSPSNGRAYEQLLGRMHRHGQKADTVHMWIYFHARELWESYMKAEADARFVEPTGGHTQKILLATKTLPDEVEAERRINTRKAWSLA